MTQKDLQKRSLAFEYVGLCKSIRQLADAHGTTYSAMYQRLKSPEMQPILEDLSQQLQMRQQDMALFMQLNGPDYLAQMDALARNPGKDQFPALTWFLNRLVPQKEEVRQHEVALTGEVAEQFAGAMTALKDVMRQLPKPGTIHDDPHLLEGEAALPRPAALDEGTEDTT